MRTQLFCSVAAIGIATALSGPVAAADMPVKSRVLPPPEPTWGGLYIGGHAGGGWARFNGGVIETLGEVLPARFTASGLAVGLHAGYNVHSGAWLWGIEGDVTATPGWRNRRCVSRGACYSEVHASGQLDALASIRGRLGMVFDRSLLYATGGVAFARRQIEAGSTAIRERSGIRVGAVVGGGLEWKYNHHLSLRVEGLYYIFNEKNTDDIRPCPQCSSRPVVFDFRDVTVIRVGASWHIQPQ